MLEALSCLIYLCLQGLRSAKCTSELSPPPALPAGDHKTELLQRLSRRNIVVPEPQPQPSRWAWLARARRLLAALPASEQQLRLGLQFTVCFLAVMFLQIADASYNALRGRPIWAVSCRPPGSPRMCCYAQPCPPLVAPARPFPHNGISHSNACHAGLQMTLVVVLFESSTGSSIRKGLLRLVGTLTGAAVGMAILYFVVLCNGLSHSNNPQASLHRQTWLALQPCGKAGAPNTPQLPTTAHTWPAAEIHPDGTAARRSMWHQWGGCRQNSWAHLHAGEGSAVGAAGCQLWAAQLRRDATSCLNWNIA